MATNDRAVVAAASLLPQSPQRRMPRYRYHRYRPSSRSCDDDCGPAWPWIIGIFGIVAFSVYLCWDRYRQARARREAEDEFLADQTATFTTNNRESVGGGTSTTEDNSSSILSPSPPPPPPLHFPSGLYEGTYRDCANFQKLYPAGRTHVIPPFEMTFVNFDDNTTVCVPGMFTVHGKGQDRVGEYILQGRHASDPPFRMVLTKEYQRFTVGVPADGLDPHGRREGYYLAQDGRTLNWSGGGTSRRDDPMGDYRRRPLIDDRLFRSTAEDNIGHEVHMQLTEGVEEETGRRVLSGRYYFAWHRFDEGGSITLWPVAASGGGE